MHVAVIVPLKFAYPYLLGSLQGCKRVSLVVWFHFLSQCHWHLLRICHRVIVLQKFEASLFEGAYLLFDDMNLPLVTVCKLGWFMIASKFNTVPNEASTTSASCAPKIWTGINRRLGAFYFYRLIYRNLRSFCLGGSDLYRINLEGQLL